MQCREVVCELVSYIKDELSAEAREVVHAHLRACAGCQAEQVELQQTFAALHADMVPIELSAHFRLALADRLDEATQAANQAAAPGGTSPAPNPELRVIRASERYRRESRQSFVTKLWNHARRSPYFAASLVAHAAAVVFFIFVFVRSTDDKPHQSIDPSSDESMVQDTPPLAPQIRVAITPKMAVALRVEARSDRQTATRVQGAVRVNMAATLTMARAGDKLILVADEALGCIRAYRVDVEGQPTAAAFLLKHPQGIVRRVQGTNVDQRVDIPSALATKVLGSQLALILFHFDDRTEFWSEQRWQETRAKFAWVPFTPRGGVFAHDGTTFAAILSRRKS